MKSQEMRKKSKTQLQKLLSERQEDLRSLRFALVSGKLKNVREIRETKKDIARILTIMERITHNT